MVIWELRSTKYGEVEEGREGTDRFTIQHQPDDRYTLRHKSKDDWNYELIGHFNELSEAKAVATALIKRPELRNVLTGE